MGKSQPFRCTMAINCSIYLQGIKSLRLLHGYWRVVLCESLKNTVYTRHPTPRKADGYRWEAGDRQPCGVKLQRSEVRREWIKQS